MKKYAFIAVACIGLLACEKEIDYDASGFKPKLVVNSFNTQDSFLQVDLSKSTTLLGDIEQSTVTDAVDIVLLKDNRTLLSGTLIPVEGRIKLPFKPTRGSSYQLQLSTGNLPRIVAIDSLPVKLPKLVTYGVRKVQQTNRIRININDSMGLDRYFLKVSYLGKEWNGTDSISQKYATTFTASDKSFISGIRTVATGRSYALFTDDTWDGEQKDVELILPQDVPLYPNFVPHKIVVELNILSPTLYAYYLDLQANNNVYGGPLAAVSRIEGNVDQGLGAFCFYTAVILENRLP